MNIVSKLVESLENQCKRNTLYQLRLISERQLIDYGHSSNLHSEGVRAWPWRELPENIAPLRFVQTLNLSTVSTKIEHTDIVLRRESSPNKMLHKLLVADSVGLEEEGMVSV